MTALVYLHGFISSPNSAKARQLVNYLAAQHPDVSVCIPQLANSPADVLRQLDALLQQLLYEPKTRIGLVGSSLGGFFSTVLAERYRLPAVLINPAVHPAKLAPHFLGQHDNPYTGECFCIDDGDIDVLRRMQPPSPLHGRYWLLAQEGDETLDYRQAVEFYQGQKMTIEAGGDHSFQNFDRHLAEVVAFLGLSGPQ